METFKTQSFEINNDKVLESQVKKNKHLDLLLSIGEEVIDPDELNNMLMKYRSV